MLSKSKTKNTSPEKSPLKSQKKQAKEEAKAKAKKEITEKSSARITQNPMEQRKKLPKNLNEYYHLDKDIKSGRADIEYMLILRHYQDNKKPVQTTPSPPNFFDEDNNKYTRKNRFIPPLDVLKYNTNFGTYDNLIKNKANASINQSTFNFEVGLRNELFDIKKIKKVNGFKEAEKNNMGRNELTHSVKLKKAGWNPTINPKTRNLFGYNLPPILAQNKERYNKILDYLSRPIVRVSKDGYINGDKVKRRVYEFDNEQILRYPAEHSSDQKFSDEYHIPNINVFRQLINNHQNVTMTNWSTNLRPDKKYKYSMNEIKNIEKKLRDKTEEKDKSSGK